MFDSPEDDAPPSFIGIPSPNITMGSSTPTCRGASIPDDPFAPKPRPPISPARVLNFSDFFATPAATQSSLGSRVSDGRDLPRPVLPRGGHREDEGGKSDKNAQEPNVDEDEGGKMKGAEYAESDAGSFMSRKGSPKS